MRALRVQLLSGSDARLAARSDPTEFWARNLDSLIPDPRLKRRAGYVDRSVAGMTMPFAPPHLLVLGVLCLAAALWDLARRRIPNIIVAAVLVAGLLAQATTGGVLTAIGGL